METRTFLALLGLISAFGAAFFLAQPLLKKTQERIFSARAHQQATSQTSFFALIVRNGFSLYKPLARLLLKNKYVEMFIAQGEEFLHIKGFVTTKENLCSCFCATLLTLFALLALVGRSIIFAGVVVVCGVVFTASFFKREKEKQHYELRDAVPDALRSMSVCFGAGFSLLQTFRQVAEETQDPLRRLFLQAVSELETGQTASDALTVFKQASIDELAFIAVALDIQHKAGGSIQQVLDTARESVESEIELSRSLKVQTAQAKMSARVVSVMPLLLIALFSFISQDFLAPFFQSFLGLVLLCVALAMQVGGILLVRKTLKVEVG